MKKTRVWLIYFTAPSRAEAERIARELVEKRNAACVNMLGQIRSFYRWQGRLEQGREIAVLVKTTDRKRKDAMATIRQAHSYEVPAILAWPIADGHAPFLEWVRAEA